MQLTHFFEIIPGTEKRSWKAGCRTRKKLPHGSNELSPGVFARIKPIMPRINAASFACCSRGRLPRCSSIENLVENETVPRRNAVVFKVENAARRLSYTKVEAGSVLQGAQNAAFICSLKRIIAGLGFKSDHLVARDRPARRWCGREATINDNE